MYRIDHTHLLKYTIYILMQLISCSVLLQTKVSYSTLIIKIRKVKKWKQKIMQIVVQILEIEERPLFIISFSYHIYHIYHHGSAQIEPINVGIFSVDFMWQKHILQHFEKTFVFCGSLCISHNYIRSATPPPCLCQSILLFTFQCESSWPHQFDLRYSEMCFFRTWAQNITNGGEPSLLESLPKYLYFYHCYSQNDVRKNCCS